MPGLRQLAHALALCAFLLGATATAAPAGKDVLALLQHADQNKSADHPAFARTLKELGARQAELTPASREYLAYLQAWELVYSGDPGAGIPRLAQIADHARDPTLGFRALVTLVNTEAISGRYEDAYARLDDMLDKLPHIGDAFAREQGLGVASLLYTQAGQYDLGMHLANDLLARTSDPRNACKARQLLLNTRFRKHEWTVFETDYAAAIDACEKSGETLFGNLIRADAASISVASGQPDAALRLLASAQAEVERIGYPVLLTQFDAVAAQALLAQGDLAAARARAQRAIDESVHQPMLQYRVAALEVLYRVAKQEGETTAALSWLEQFDNASKGYLSDVSARALAFQMVHQQVAANKAKVQALDQQNQLLKLKQEVDRRTMLATRMGIALLLVVLGSVLLWALRARRGQRKFQQLAQRDGLTEIRNRPYFIESAQAELAYCAKAMREASVIAIDLDHFKQVNDQHGHAAGDAALKAAVAACQQHLRSVDIFGRLGGEEFGILLPDCPPERAAELAEAMRARIAALQGSADGPEFPLSASFGVSAARWAGHALEPLLAQADAALYRAKRAGRNRVVVHGPAAADPATIAAEPLAPRQASG